VSPKLPQVSGKQIVRLLQKLNYKIIRQRGSHIRLRKITNVGEHNITIPNHKIIAKGTLNDILTKVSIWNDIPKDNLIGLIK